MTLKPEVVVDAKGDLLVGRENNLAARLPVGADGSVLTADSTAQEGVSWSDNATSESVLVAGQDLQGAVGTPGIALAGTVGNRSPAMAFDASTDEAAACYFRVPTGWTSITVSYLWTNLGAGAGDVRWRLGYERFGSGSTLGTTTVQAIHVRTAPAQNVISVLEAGTFTVIPGETVRIEVYRSASNAADTLANDAGVLGVIVGKA